MINDVLAAGEAPAHLRAVPPLGGRRRPEPNRAGVWSAFSQRDAEAAGKAIKLALIGGQRLLRDGTANLLAQEDGLQMLGTYDSVASYLALGADQTPDVLLLDCDEGDGWQRAIERLRTPYLESRLVLLCGSIGEQVIRYAIEESVSGVILKSYTPRETREAIAYIATGRTVMPVGWQRAFERSTDKPLGLSPRHRQILALIAQGRGNEEIASELDLSRNTVKFHVRVLYSRLGVRNRVEAANQYAMMTRGDD